jgi:hypothetical protein
MIFSMQESMQSQAKQAICLAPSTSPIPAFLVQRQPAASDLWQSIKAVCARNSSAHPAALLPFRKSFLAQAGPSGSFLGVSFLLHCMALAGLIYLPLFIPERPAPLAFVQQFDTKIYYAVPVTHHERQLPSIAPQGQAGRPGEGSEPEQVPNLGTAISMGDLTVISKPLQPDNYRQTIIQPLSPPEMRITEDVKLPNVILGNLSAPRAPLTFAASAMPKPEQTDHQIAAAPAPIVTDQTHSNAVPLLTANEPAIAKPLPPVALQKPVQQAHTGSAQASQTAAPAPIVTDQTHADAAPLLAANEPVISKPLPPVALQKPIQPGRIGSGQGSQSAAPAPVVTDQTHGDAAPLLAANEPVIAKPLLPVALQKPTQQARAGSGQGSQAPAPAPVVTDQTHGDAVPLLAANQAAIAKPLPPVALQKPIQQGRNGSGQASQSAAPAPVVTDQTHGDAVPLLAANQSAIAKPLPPVALQRPIQQGRAGGGQSSQGASSVPVLSDANGLMIVSVDPSATASQIAVPPGNRWGDFAIAPGHEPGSPGGNPGSANAGAGSTAKNGAGGEKSVGVGPGGSGGGGGPSSASLGPISVKGTLPAATEPLLLTSSVVAEMVYPLPVAVVAKLRQNRMVVSAGSIGGGGLNIYGALACGKIYTIFLPMPGANWTMQFCQKSAATVPDTPQTQARVIQMESPLVPPDPDSDSRFDFKRVPLPPEKEHNPMIVLKGVLRDDGTIGDLEVYQGVLAEMDQAAQLALSRWKFKPAMRANKAVSVEILVGIPAEVPASNSGIPSQQQEIPPSK